jgi:Family of unknown function (DUF6101)
VTGGATVGSSRAYRLDPHTLPARSSPLGDATAAAFIIEHDRVIVQKSLGTGLLVPTSVPIKDYAGVAVRMEPIGDLGNVRAFVELLHDDPALTILLAVTDDPEEIAGDWQAWGRTLNLPLLIIGQDGSVGMPLGAHGIAMARPKPRRRHSYFAKRRPRFLTRRKNGRPELMEQVTGREIIARD